MAGSVVSFLAGSSGKKINSAVKAATLGAGTAVSAKNKKKTGPRQNFSSADILPEESGGSRQNFSSEDITPKEGVSSANRPSVLSLAGSKRRKRKSIIGSSDEDTIG